MKNGWLNPFSASANSDRVYSGSAAPLTFSEGGGRSYPGNPSEDMNFETEIEIFLQNLEVSTISEEDPDAINFDEEETFLASEEPLKAEIIAATMDYPPDA